MKGDEIENQCLESIVFLLVHLFHPSVLKVQLILWQNMLRRQRRQTLWQIGEKLWSALQNCQQV